MQTKDRRAVAQTVRQALIRLRRTSPPEADKVLIPRPLGRIKFSV